MTQLYECETQGWGWAADMLPLLLLDTNTKRTSKRGRTLVLVLGGVSHRSSPDYALNLIYKRLEERPPDSALDVVVVDPDPWQSIPLGRVQHVQKRFENYLSGEEITRLFGAYETIAVIDDVFFTVAREREALVRREGWRALALAVETHLDKCTWWVIKHNNGSLQVPELVRMSGNISLTTAHRRKGVPGHPLSLVDDSLFNVWNPIVAQGVDWEIIQHPFRGLLPRLMQRPIRAKRARESSPTGSTPVL